MKEWLKSQLRAVGLYSAAQELWGTGRNLRVSCRNVGYRLAGADDGLPIPPARLIYLVTISREIAWFYHSGRMCQQSLCYALKRNGFNANNFGAILDFGCGCGRVMRHWNSLKGPKLYGTDYNPELISWCQRQLGNLAEFKTNNLTPPLDYANEQFDLIYAISVFTHLTEDLQYAWLNELGRVLKRAGLVLITLHGESRLGQLETEEQQRFRAGELIVKQHVAVGSNECGAFHPERYVRHRLAQGFEILDFIPVGVRDTDQDIYVLRKPA